MQPADKRSVPNHASCQSDSALALGTTCPQRASSKVVEQWCWGKEGNFFSVSIK